MRSVTDVPCGGMSVEGCRLGNVITFMGKGCTVFEGGGFTGLREIIRHILLGQSGMVECVTAVQGATVTEGKDAYSDRFA